MRQIGFVLLGIAMLFVATASWAAGSDVAVSAPSPAVSAPLALEAPAQPAPDPGLLPILSAPEPVLAAVCPRPPTTSCQSCALHTFPPTQSVHSCTLFCQNGVLRQVCSACGEC
ncbi:MAG: hypothetical protein JF614_14460 [Acidobacteria bacterium]|nr:hypothetical protein [Acidobacteriota bacterium]